MPTQKCLPLGLLQPTKIKERLLRETYSTFLSMARVALGASNSVRSRGQLHKVTYGRFKEQYGVASQLVIEATSYAWSIRKSSGCVRGIHKCIVRFDSRLFSFKRTARGNPVLSLRLNKGRVAIPISQDGAYKRFLQHLRKDWHLTSIIMKHDLSLLAVLSKEMPKPPIRLKVIGIDINSSKIAVTIIGNGKVLKQCYFGQDLSTKQFLFTERRRVLQKYRDTTSKGKAGLKLKCLSGKQRNYIRTRVWQIANEIISLANTFNANIKIERLRHIGKRKGQFNKNIRRKINRIPCGFFRHALKCVAERKSIAVSEINPRYTSQTCPRCGYTGKENWTNYSYFRCKNCGYEADRDRVASLNIALRASQSPSATAQVPRRGASVSSLVWQDEGCERLHQITPSCKPTNSFVGN